MIENKGFKIYMTRGDDVVINLDITIVNDDDSRTPYIMEDGDTLTLTIKHNSEYGNEAAILQKVYTAPQVSIFHDDTKDLEYGLYLYDIVLKTSEGLIYTLIIDTIELTKEGGI